MIAMDAPLYALAKLTQCNWPHTHGEDKYVVIEMAIWNKFGDYLEASGWTTALIQAGIVSSGIAASFINTYRTEVINRNIQRRRECAT